MSKPAIVPRRILVVDDQEMNRDLASTILRQAGHEIELAPDGAVAVHMARTRQLAKPRTSVFSAMLVRPP